MNLSDPSPARPRERILPMINVAFLLLIMVVMLAEFTAQAPFDVAPPEATGTDRARQEIVLFVAADGGMGFRGLMGEDAVFAALDVLCDDAVCSADAKVTVKADRDLSGVAFARLLGRLQSAGFDRVEIVTVLQ